MSRLIRCLPLALGLYLAMVDACEDPVMVRAVETVPDEAVCWEQPTILNAANPAITVFTVLLFIVPPC